MIPKDPNKEAKIQKLIADQQEAASAITLIITKDFVSTRSPDGDGDYPIKSRSTSDDGKFILTVELDDEGPVEWEGKSIGGRYLLFADDSDLGQFVWERASEV